jgi:hypothetical protein
MRFISFGLIFLCLLTPTWAQGPIKIEQQKPGISLVSGLEI